MRIAVFVSGTGRTLKNFLNFSKTYRFRDLEICLVIANRECLALEIAKQNNLRWMLIEDAHICGCKIAYDMGAELICLGGFQRLLSVPDDLAPVWHNRILNAHPSLIPAFCGKGYQAKRVYTETMQRGVQFTGTTIHFCDSDYDHGPIIYQRVVKIDPAWTVDDLAIRVFEEECIAYPHALDAIRLYQEEYATDYMIDADAVAKIARGAYPDIPPAERGKKPLTNPADMIQSIHE